MHTSWWGPKMDPKVLGQLVKRVLDTSLLNTQYYSSVKQFRERRSEPLHLGVVAIENGASGQPWQRSPTLLIYVYHHHDVSPSARVSLILSRHPSLSSNASDWPSRLHPVSAHSSCMSVLAGRPAFVRPCEGVHGSMSLMSSTILLQQCPAYLVRLTWIVFVMSGKWPYRTCSILLAAFLCSCRQTFSQYVWLSSM